MRTCGSRASRGLDEFRITVLGFAELERGEREGCEKTTIAKRVRGVPKALGFLEGAIAHAMRAAGQNVGPIPVSSRPLRFRAAIILRAVGKPGGVLVNEPVRQDPGVLMAAKGSTSSQRHGR